MPFLARFRRLSCTLSLFVLIGSFVAVPALAGQESPTQESASSPQGKFIMDLGTRAIEILRDKSMDQESRQKLFRQLLSDTFDLETIARFVLGRNWLSTTPEQKTEYLRLFETLVVKTYSDRFSLYTSEGFQVRSVDPEGKKDFIVNSEITHTDGSKPTAVTWRVRQRNDRIGIIDVIVEGVSMSVTQRQEYSAIIQRNGGDIESLLTMMRERVGEKKKEEFKKG